ncbi:MAG: MBL fold metallo-hydrolase [Treponemataceae bacterium]
MIAFDMRFTIMGSGTSHGVPVIACPCPVCCSTDPLDIRLRSSALIENKDTALLIDIGPDFRQQALKHKIQNLDAILLTHSHADHVHGLDDMRIFSIDKPIPIYANQQTLDDIQNRFDYIFKNSQQGGGKPRLELHACNHYTKEDPLFIKEFSIIPIPLKHGCIESTGWRVGKIAYLTDLNDVPHESFESLEGIEILIIDALRQRKHQTHCNFSDALKIASKTSAQKIYFTHICHDFSHEQIKLWIKNEQKNLPDLQGRIIAPAYDGLYFEY